MPKVYITQVPTKRDVATNKFVPSIDLSPACRHGEPVVMIPSGFSFYATADLVRKMRSHLKDYDYEAGDSLVALGDPTAIAAAAAILGSMCRKFKMLKWDKQLGEYQEVHIAIS